MSIKIKKNEGGWGRVEGGGGYTLYLYIDGVLVYPHVSTVYPRESRDLVTSPVPSRGEISYGRKDMVSLAPKVWERSLLQTEDGGGGLSCILGGGWSLLYPWRGVVSLYP